MPEGTTTPRFGDARLPQRFWDKVRVDPDGCWRWTAFCNLGYGQYHLHGKGVGAHVASYRFLVAEIPAGYEVDHLCHVPDKCQAVYDCPHRRCVNPSHLKAVTSRANVLRGNTVTRANAIKTHCVNGHEFSTENTRVDKRGRRACKICVEEAGARYRARMLADPATATVYRTRKAAKDARYKQRVREQRTN